MSLRRAPLCIVVLCATACAQEVIVRDLPTEKEANEIIEVLAMDGITGMKQVVDDGRKKFYQIAVYGSRRLDAINILN
ncbi:MAG: hypothetical protein AAF658_10800, partial [Myxococcota bacterium]